MPGLYQTESGEWRTVPRPVALREVIRSALLNALAYAEGHQANAARLLGISPRMMDYQMQRYDIPRHRCVEHTTFNGRRSRQPAPDPHALRREA